jgi:methionine synthase II (cobalamin-independent)
MREGAIGMRGLNGLATGIGSLPHKDVDAALDLVFKYVPQAPFWPQLPKRNSQEGMVEQFSEGLPRKEEELEAYYERIISGDTGYFQVSENRALGLYKFLLRLKQADLKDILFIKGHTTGPFTFCAGLNDSKGVSLLHDKVMMQALSKGLALKAAWQIGLLREFAKPQLFFIDEPYLGCFGSAFTPINREDVVSGLSEFSSVLKSDDVAVGVHCCGNTEWSMLMEVSDISVISFDAFDFLDRLVLYADALKKFLKRGGVLCWGIVPTHGFTGAETPDTLVQKIQQGVKALKDKGLDEGILFERMLLSPSCGLGTLAPEKAEKIFDLLCETSHHLGKIIKK